MGPHDSGWMTFMSEVFIGPVKTRGSRGTCLESSRHLASRSPLACGSVPTPYDERLHEPIAVL